MKLLLDTHVFLWYISADPKLPGAFQTAIQNEANQVFLSVVSTWEAVIKYGLGKLPLPSPPEYYFSLQRIAHGIRDLTIDGGAMVTLARLPALHRDPFDRILIAQALQHGLTIATVDAAVAEYPVPVLPPA